MKLRHLIPLLFIVPAAAIAQPVSTSTDKAVLILPFASLAPDTSSPWLGQAIQQDLVADLAKADDLNPSAPDLPTPHPNDTDAALAVARKANTPYVILGNYQTNGPQLRMSAQLFDASTGKRLGAAIATGQFRDLFALEDSLGKQLRHTLSPNTPDEPSPSVQPAQTTQSAPAQPAAPAPILYQFPTNASGYTPTSDYDTAGSTSPIVINNNVPSSDNYAGSNPYYGYPYAGYGYPYFFGGTSFVIVQRNPFHHRDQVHFHDGFHDGFHGSFHDGIHFHSSFGGPHGTLTVGSSTPGPRTFAPVHAFAPHPTTPIMMTPNARPAMAHH